MLISLIFKRSAIEKVLNSFSGETECLDINSTMFPDGSVKYKELELKNSKKASSSPSSSFKDIFDFAHSFAETNTFEGMLNAK